mgnify:CR=1 FL=1
MGSSALPERGLGPLGTQPPPRMLERAASNVMSPTPISPPLTLQAALAMDGALVCDKAARVQPAQ